MRAPPYLAPISVSLSLSLSKSGLPKSVHEGSVSIPLRQGCQNVSASLIDDRANRQGKVASVNFTAAPCAALYPDQVAR